MRQTLFRMMRPTQRLLNSHKPAGKKAPLIPPEVYPLIAFTGFVVVLAAGMSGYHLTHDDLRLSRAGKNEAKKTEETH